MQSDMFKKGGAFAENVRSTVNDDLTELVASLKEHGWVPEFPALVDENGVILVGHRRMKAAEIVGVSPVIKQLVLGAGDAADAERVRLAIVSNIGAKPLTKEDRQRIAQHLYGSREWTMERIAEALNVRKGTISKDLSGIVSSGNNSALHPKTVRNPKGAGRPKTGPRTTKAGESEVTRKVREYVRPLVERGEPLSVQEVAKASGHSRIVSEAAIAFERGRQAGLKEAADLAPVDITALSKTAKDRLAAMEVRLRAQFEAEIELRVREEVRLRLARRDEEDADVIEQANELMAHNTGRLRPPFTPEQYYQILWALHPDNNDKAKLTNAFVMMRQKKLVLCEEGPIKRKSSLATPLPKTAAELLERKRMMKQAAAGRA